MDSIRQILARLNEHEVEFVVIGGVAAILHGSARATLDVDICAPLVEPNLSRIIAALKGSNPRWRMRPDRPPLSEDPEKLRGFQNLYLETDMGILDILNEVTGIGPYDQVLPNSTEIDLGEMKLRVLTLEALIRAKHAAARRKDIDAVKELEVIHEKLQKRGPQ